MQTSTIVMLGGVGLIAILAILLIASRSDRLRHPNLRPLSPESQDRYVTQWDRIESLFLDSPSDAVKEADALLLSLLAERGHPVAKDKLPREMQRARRKVIGQEGEGGTEGMRQALLHYRAVVEEYARPVEHGERTHEGRREAAG
jgi:hypothetical protein